MNIITMGVVPELKIYKGTCGSCGSVIEANHKEINHTHDSHHLGVCPVCESRMSFDVTDGIERGPNDYKSA